MKKSGLFRILIIYPPLINPSAPPPIGESDRIFNQEGLATERYDASIDFFKNHLFDSRKFEQIIGLIEKKDKSGVFEKADDKTRARVFDVLKSGERFKQRIVQAGRDLDFFMSQDFYKSSSYITKASEIKSLCDDLSLAFYPSRIHWNGFSNPDIFESKGLTDLVRDPEKNPFIEFFEKGMDLSGIGKSDLLILHISAQNQVTASLTLSGICRKRGFSCHIALMADPALLVKAKGFSANLVPANDSKAAADLLGKLGFKKRTFKNTGSKVKKLPPGGYLCPEKVIAAPKIGSCENFFDNLISEPGVDKKISDIKNILNIHKAIRPVCAIRLSGRGQPFCMAVECPLEYQPGKEVISTLFSSGVKLIEWHAPGDMPASGPGPLTKALWSASKCGIWNHLITHEKTNPELLEGLLNYASNNPHYCHSWAVATTSDTKYGKTFPHSAKEPPYGEVTPLSGYPFWRGCMDVFHLLVHINKSGTKKVIRWRINESGTSIDTIGENITYHYKKPGDLSPQSFEQICLLVEAGGAVGKKWIRHNLEKAYLIGFAMEEGTIAGTVSLKNPRQEFIEYIKGKTGINLSDFVERGYNSARPQYRGLGIGSVLVKGLTERVGEKRLYSTISSDNLVAQEIARRTGTKNVAVYYSERLGKDVGVWIPSWMLDD